MATNKKLEKVLFCSNHYKDDKEFLSEWKARTSFICKPCWELKYCPYGPLVEDFPLLPLTKSEIKAHNSYLEKCLKTGKLSDGRLLGKKREKEFKKSLEFNSSRSLPEKIPQIFRDASCNIFGHICPVFFVAKPFTETKEIRRSGRNIPRDIMLKVVRRDGQICQECHCNVPDTNIEFDHLIPASKGGPINVDNLRVLCKECNRKKSNSLEKILEK
jgi:hypothetical protein